MKKHWYIIQSNTTRIMKHRFTDFTEAVTEARGYADRNPSQEYIILESVGGFKSVVKKSEVVAVDIKEAS